MASGVGGIRGAVSEIGEQVQQAVVKPVKDQVGQALEEGAQSVVDTPKPQQQAQQQNSQQKMQAIRQEESNIKQQDQVKIRNIHRFLNQFNTDSQRLGQLRQAEQQKKAQEEQEAVKKKEEKQLEEQKKQAMHPALAAKGKSEIKRGVGG